MPLTLSPQHKFLFLHIPKNAGVSIYSSLSSLPLLRRSYFQRIYSRLTSTAHITKPISGNMRFSNLLALEYANNGHLDMYHIKTILGLPYLKSLFIFTYVRNPINRLFSEFQFVLRRPAHTLSSSFAQNNFKDFLLYKKSLGAITQSDFLMYKEYPSLY